MAVRLRNGPDSFGLVSRLLHWGIMLLVIGMLALGQRLDAMQPGLANLWLYGLHKTLGLTVLALMLARLGWHAFSPPPRPLARPGWELWAARAAHWGFYALLIAIPLTGWAGSSATGIDTLFADRWVVPPLVEPGAEAEAYWFGLHDILTKVLFALILVHMLAALRHEMAGEGTLTRMIRGRADP
jgi:cytochrome b561